MLADGACAALLCSSLWGSARPLALGGWLLSVAAIGLARLELARRHARQHAGTRAFTSDASDARRWGARFVLGSAASGVAWGAVAWLSTPGAPVSARLLAGLLIGAQCSLGASLFGVYLPAAASFVAPALGGLALELMLLEGAPRLLGAAVVVYGIGSLGVSRVLWRTLAPAPEAPPPLAAREAKLTRMNRELEQGLLERGEALRKQAEALRDAQRLEAVGRLAGGVAHDFNNLLTVLLADISELAAQDGADVHTLTTLREMRDAATKGAALVRQLLTFSRRTHDTPETLDLNRTLANMDRLLGRLLGGGLSLRLELQVLPLFVHMDPTQMEQVILNLVTNARDAMPGGGVISVRTDTLELRESRRALAPRSYARLSVSDTGTGMDAETQRHIFEPFFTTKEVGKGTGLGLSTTHHIVQQGGGDIEVLSEPGRGSCFQVCLPLAERPRELHPEGAKSRTFISGFRQVARAPRHVTVLLVEDEPTVRSVTRRILESAGHTVITSPSAERALELASEHSGLLELLITDVVMTGMDGPALSARLRATRTELRTLFISGYGREQVMPPEQPEDTAFLAKPFTHEALLGKVLELLAVPAPVLRAAAQDDS